MPYAQPRLVECFDCRNSVSIDAKACPHCGLEKPAFHPTLGKTAAEIAWEQSEEGQRERAQDREEEARRQKIDAEASRDRSRGRELYKRGATFRIFGFILGIFPFLATVGMIIGGAKTSQSASAPCCSCPEQVFTS